MAFTSSFLGRNGPKRLWKNRGKSMGSPSLSDLHHSFAGKQLTIFTLDALKHVGFTNWKMMPKKTEMIT